MLLIINLLYECSVRRPLLPGCLTQFLLMSLMHLLATLESRRIVALAFNVDSFFAVLGQGEHCQADCQLCGSIFQLGLETCLGRS